MVKSIVKRDGRVVLYDESKITVAILKSLKAAGEGDAEQASLVARAVGRRHLCEALAFRLRDGEDA